MARARNIKPSIFKNELLGAEDPLLTLLFISLWMLADREGRLEDRPLRIKAETFPYRDNLDINGYLTVLQRLGFIHRYRVNELALIQIVNFKKHQAPHHTEKQSGLPSIEDGKPVGCGNPDITVKQPLSNGESPVPLPPDSLIPDSLIPDSGILIPESKTKEHIVEQARPPTKETVKLEEITQIFNHWKNRLGHPRAQLTESRRKVIAKARKSGYSIQDCMTAIDGCAATPFNVGENDRGERYDSIELILRDAPHIDRFMRNAKNPPRPMTKADMLLANNTRVAQEFLAEDN